MDTLQVQKLADARVRLIDRLKEMIKKIELKEYSPDIGQANVATYMNAIDIDRNMLDKNFPTRKDLIKKMEEMFEECRELVGELCDVSCKTENH